MSLDSPFALGLAAPPLHPCVSRQTTPFCITASPAHRREWSGHACRAYNGVIWLSQLVMTTVHLVSSPDPTLCEGKGIWCIWTQSLGQGKEFERSNQIAALSKSCDYLLQEVGRTNHNAGLFLLCNLLNCPRSCFDQSEYRFVPLL